MRRLAVGDVMTRNFIAVRPSTHLLDCAKEMVKKRVNSLLISENSKLVGILTQKDILWAITKKPNINLKSIKAIDIAARKVAVIKPSAELSEAFRKMKRFNFRRLPVISKGRLVGMLTLNDILKIEPTFYQDVGDLVDIKEESKKLKQVDVEWPLEGLCEECGQFGDLLKVYDRLLCADCREELY